MMHRTTVMAVPIVSLVVLGAGLGWWGYDQNRQRQALVQTATNEYVGAFHGLVSDVNSLHEETDKALIASDKPAFDGRVRQMWRLTYAAQTDLSRLPSGVIPTGNIHSFLAQMASTTDDWLQRGVDPSAPFVRKQLPVLSRECTAVAERLNNLQPQAYTGNLTALVAIRATDQTKRDNAMVAGMKEIDGMAATYVSTAPTQPSGKPIGRLASEKPVTDRQAISILGAFTDIAKKTPWTVQLVKNSRFVPTYAIQGDTDYGHLFGRVSKPGGQVLSYHLDHMPTTSTIDFSTIEQRAVQWAKDHHIQDPTVVDARQADNIAYFTVAPSYQHVPVLSQSIFLGLGMDTGRIISYDGSNFYAYPVTGSLPARRFTTAHLRAKVSPILQVKMDHTAIMLDENRHYQPVVVFYGTNQGRTYRVVMNAHTGLEMNAERVSPS